MRSDFRRVDEDVHHLFRHLGRHVGCDGAGVDAICQDTLFCIFDIDVFSESQDGQLGCLRRDDNQDVSPMIGRERHTV